MYADLLKKFDTIEAGGLKGRLFRPLRESGKKYPLVLFLHGMGERGDDNRAQIANTGGAHLWAWDDVQMDTPCYILAPQCPAGSTWVKPDTSSAVMHMLSHVCAADDIDTMRIYICGLSMGGCGTWHIAAANTDTFAAALPVCGAAEPWAATGIGQLPLWALHSVDDGAVHIDGDLRDTIPSLADNAMYGSRLSVSEAARAGSRNIKYTEYPAGYIAGKYPSAHHCWEEVFRDDEVRHWLFAQNRAARDTYSMVVPGVYECCDAFASSYYIVEGSQRALVIDTGMGAGDINSFVQRITRLPYSLALTHGHGDHSMHCAKFDRVYLQMDDREFLYSMRFDGQPLPDESSLQPINGGDCIDLGGGVEIDVVALPGHTPGSVLFVDKYHKCVFTGDAVGSGCGVWMQVPLASNISEYAKAIASAKAQLLALGVDGTWAFLGGHAGQRWQSGVKRFNPILLTLFDDMISLCEKLISGEITGSGEGLESLSERFGTSLKACYATAEMIYRPEQLK